MKRLKILTTITLLFVAFSIHAQTVTETFKVYGNCHTCEKKIEKAAKSAGATQADWNKDTKMIKVTYDNTKTSNDAIQKKIASAGYDTENFTGDDKAYNSLDECCQYQRKSASK
ncbi:MAG TPA: heavy-metal-associated domain-containing protein [Flavipsychrobacter sp.]|nr:heavy-metal-associated domain-containing protein [Flavipsychrobacter sp.]